MDKNDIAISSRSTILMYKLVQLIYTLTVHRCLDKTVSLIVSEFNDLIYRFLMI